MSPATEWQAAFWHKVQEPTHASVLRDAAMRGALGAWTSQLTTTAVETCQAMGWQAAAKGHGLDLLPFGKYEYLSLDVLAFPSSGGKWRFPVAAIELENDKDVSRIAYSLWKVLSVRAVLRIVFCYRTNPDEAGPLVRSLADDVVKALDVDERLQMKGSMLVVVGSRGEAQTFPYGFFKWWQLDKNTGLFALLT